MIQEGEVALYLGVVEYSIQVEGEDLFLGVVECLILEGEAVLYLVAVGC